MGVSEVELEVAGELEISVELDELSVEVEEFSSELDEFSDELEELSLELVELEVTEEFSLTALFEQPEKQASAIAAVIVNKIFRFKISLPVKISLIVKKRPQKIRRRISLPVVPAVRL